MPHKKLYITTAIPYVNAKPHIGNALDYLLADIWTRYQKQNGSEVRFAVGTDEHGNKIAAKAKEQNMEPQAYTDVMVESFKTMISSLGAEPTDFIRTTEARHAQTVGYIWQQLQPYIYKGTYQGWYCVGCESFVTDKEATANNGICSEHNQSYQRLSEENYYFKLSAFGPQIKQAIESRKLEIAPSFRQAEILKLLNDGLQDISISRPLKNLSWGIPVPGDPTQVIYVWIDALSNYLTVLGYPHDESWREFWPADVQVIGKNIARFHAAIWPAMLIALQLTLPKKLLVHGFINVSGVKMSKTIGNVVDPLELIGTYGVDAFRYYFARHIPTQGDGDFTRETFEVAYNSELGNELGNLVSRVAGMVTRYQEGVMSDLPQPEHDAAAYHDAMKSLQFNIALDEVWAKVRALNVYIDNVKPWKVAATRDTDPEAAEHLAEILSYAAGSILQIADLLVPFLPGAAAGIRATFASGVIAPQQSTFFERIHNHTPAAGQSQTSDVVKPEAPAEPEAPTSEPITDR